MFLQDPGYSASNKLIVSVAIADLLITIVFGALITAGDISIMGFLIIAIIVIANFASFMLLICTSRRNENRNVN